MGPSVSTSAEKYASTTCPVRFSEPSCESPEIGKIQDRSLLAKARRLSRKIVAGMSASISVTDDTRRPACRFAHVGYGRYSIAFRSHQGALAARVRDTISVDS